jgi:hypothetical protein
MLRRITFFLSILSFTACSNNQVKPFSCWKEPVTGMEFVLIPKGIWYFGADNAQSFMRRTHEPSLWGFSIGFRIVCEKEETQNI